MEELITPVLKAAFVRLQSQIPQTKKQIESLSICDTSPLGMSAFMAENGIPDDAYFSGRDNGYDAWDDILICWEIDVPTTEKDKLAFCKERFERIAFKFVSDELKSKNYQRVPYSISRSKQFADTSVYQMYLDKEFGKLANYYSLFFCP